MSLEIPANDHGRIYVYTVSGPLASDLKSKSEGALEKAFGVPIDPPFVDVVDPSELSGLPLSGYVAQGYDMPADGMDAALLDNLKGTVVMLMSRAFRESAVTLNPATGVEYRTTLAEPTSFTPTEPLRSEAAKGSVPPAPQKAPPSQAAQSGRVATIALVVLFLLVGIMLWIAA